MALTELILSICTMIACILVAGLMICCIYNFKRYLKTTKRIDPRRKVFLVMEISYYVMIILMIEETIASVYYYAKNKTQHIFYSASIDIKIHYLFWVGFWLFIMLRVFRFCMVRFDLENNYEHKNAVWKRDLNTGSPESYIKWLNEPSIFIKYNKLFGDKYYMLLLSLVNMTIIIIIQIIVATFTESAVSEQIFIISICPIIIIFIWYIYHKMPAYIDINCVGVIEEIQRQLIVSTIIYIVYCFCVIIWSTTHLEFIWLRCANSLILTIWIALMCYYETWYILKTMEQDAISSNNIGSNQRKLFKDKFPSMEITQTQQGYEAFMMFLCKEFSHERGLFMVEATFYINKWAVTKYKYNEIRPVLIEYIGSNTYIPHDIMILIMDYYIKLYPKRLNILPTFPFLGEPKYENEMDHWEYIIKKYIDNDSLYQIRTSYESRAEQINPMTQTDGECCDVMNDMMTINGTLIRHSFGRFARSEEYKQWQRHQK